MNRTAVINIAGLSESLFGPHTTHLNRFRQRGAFCRIAPAFPAVTCTAQANYLTGLPPAQHGIVGNGWYNRELAEVQFWKQSNHLVGGKKLWERLREADPQFTCAQLFWWFNMYSTADWSITPRPIYAADGRKIFDIYAWPYSVRTEIKRDLGEFPFPAFWGPAAGAETARSPADAASRWIAESAKWIERRFTPTLSLVYLPHLDYNLQRLGPDHAGIAADLKRIDTIVGDLLDFFRQQSVQVVLLSEYGISAVDTPIHLNRLFREQGWISVKEELGRELLDAGAARALLEKQLGVAEIWGSAEKRAGGLDHPRAGDLIAVAQDGAWFTYYYWQDDHRAPDFARTVDIHRKPGYDPVELFLDPTAPLVRAKIAWRLVQKRLGFRMLMDVIPLDASLVKGSHGRHPARAPESPVLISSCPKLVPKGSVESTGVGEIIRQHVLG